MIKPPVRKRTRRLLLCLLPLRGSPVWLHLVFARQSILFAPLNRKMDHGMRVELMVSVLQTGALSVSPSVEKLCKAGFLPANHTRVNGFRFCRYAIFVGGVRRPIRVPLLRFRSTGHDRQGPRAVVGPSEFPSDLSTPRRLTPTRRIQGTSSKLLAHKCWWNREDSNLHWIASQTIASANWATIPKVWCPRGDSNPYCGDFKSPDSTNWSTGAVATVPDFAFSRRLWIAVWAPEKHAGLGVCAYWNRRQGSNLHHPEGCPYPGSSDIGVRSGLCRAIAVRNEVFLKPMPLYRISNWTTSTVFIH